MHLDADAKALVQGEMINEAGTLTGGGGKPRGGRMCLGTAAPRAIDSREAASELASAEQQLEQQLQVQFVTNHRPWNLPVCSIPHRQWGHVLALLSSELSRQDSRVSVCSSSVGGEAADVWPDTSVDGQWTLHHQMLLV